MQQRYIIVPKTALSTLQQKYIFSRMNATFFGQTIDLFHHKKYFEDIRGVQRLSVNLV